MNPIAFTPCASKLVAVIPPLALAVAVTSMLGTSHVWGSSATLAHDSYVTTPFVAGVTPRHGVDGNLLINKANTAFLLFRLDKMLPTGVLATDIDKATLKLFLSKVNGTGAKRNSNLTLRQVMQAWDEKTLPKQGIAPVVDQSAKNFRISRSYQGHWLELDVTELVYDLGR